MPPIKLDLKSKPETLNGSPRLGLRHSQSSDSGLPSTSAPPYEASPTHRPTASGSSFGASIASLHSPVGQTDESRSSTHLQTPVTPTPRLSFESHPRDSPLSSPQIDRPPLKTSQTLPAQMSNLDHNAWADEDDEFGKEKEVTMSFE